jgi:hypothetical protein
MSRLATPWRADSRPVYLALPELVRRYSLGETSPTSSEAPLTGYEYRVFSQNGEDGVIAELLRRVGVRGRWFVEFGIQNGREGNCVFLADVIGWSGLFMEAQENDYRELQRKYAGNPAVQTRQALVGPENIEQLLASADVPVEPDILSIDIDGNDYWIWQAITNYSPRIVIIEYNSHWPHDARWVQPYDPTRGWQGTSNFGASLGALHSLGEQKGYRLVHSDLTGSNAFFVRADIEAVLPAPDVIPLRGPNSLLMASGYPEPAPPAPPILDLDAPGADQGNIPSSDVR